MRENVRGGTSRDSGLEPSERELGKAERAHEKTFVGSRKIHESDAQLRE
jgi:hypothetical protein